MSLSKHVDKKIKRLMDRLWSDRKLKAAMLPPLDPDIDDGKIVFIDYPSFYLSFCAVSGKITAFVEIDECGHESYADIDRVSDIYEWIDAIDQ